MATDETHPMRVAVGTDPNSQIIGPTFGQERPTDYKHITLRTEAAHNGALSEQEGRPVYDRVVMLRFIYPGSQDQLDVEILRWKGGQDKPSITDAGRYNMFREVIDRFVAGQEAAEAGTPLAVLNMPPDVIEELSGMRIKTVEMLCDVADVNVNAIKNNGRAWRDRARAFRDASAGGVHMAKLQAENEGLRSDMAETRRQLDEVKAERASEKAAAVEGTSPVVQAASDRVDDEIAKMRAEREQEKQERDSERRAAKAQADEMARLLAKAQGSAITSDKEPEDPPPAAGKPGKAK